MSPKMSPKTAISIIEQFKKELIKIKYWAVKDENKCYVNVAVVILDTIIGNLSEPDKPQLKVIKGRLE